jgi:hypothetical protein
MPRPRPDLAWAHQELKRPGVTLQRLHLEYLQQHPAGYRSSQFCRHYHEWARRLAPTMRQVHRAGAKVFVDFSGKRPVIVDATTPVRPHRASSAGHQGDPTRASGLSVASASSSAAHILIFVPVCPRAARLLASFSGWAQKALTVEQQHTIRAALDNPRAGWNDAAGIVIHYTGLTLWQAVARANSALKRGPGAVGEVVRPPAQHAIELVLHLAPRRFIARTEDLPDASLDPLDRLLGRRGPHVLVTSLPVPHRPEV